MKFLIALVLCACGFAQSPNFRVKLEVSTDDDDFRAQLTSRMGAELRALGDTTIVTDNPFFGILVTAVTLRSCAAPKLYAVGVTCVMYSDIERAKQDAGKRECEGAGALSWMRNRIEDQLYAGVRTGADISNLAKGIVADFDMSAAQPMRDALRKLLEFGEKLKREAAKPKPPE